MSFLDAYRMGLSANFVYIFDVANFIDKKSGKTEPTDLVFTKWNGM